MKNIIKNTNKKGFTIVELVIVIAVIAILAGVLIPTFTGIINKANESAAKQEAQAVYKEVYALDISDGELDGEINGETTGDLDDFKAELNKAGVKLATGAELTKYAPNATATEGDKFVYKASNGKTVRLTFVDDVETWTAA